VNLNQMTEIDFFQNTEARHMGEIGAIIHKLIHEVIAMERSKFTEAQIVFAIKQVDKSNLRGRRF
jgi:hypothetical protein